MKLMMSFLIIFGILVSSCATKPKEKIVYKYIEKPVYIECTIPDLPEKPEFHDYQVMRIEFENKYYYCLEKDQAKILITNWLNYRNWCENTYIILKELKK